MMSTQNGQLRIARKETSSSSWMTCNLELNAFSIELNSADLEVYADGGDKGRCPCIVAESEEQTRLANTYRQMCDIQHAM